MLLTDLVPRVLAHASGCPDILAVEELRDAAIQFMEDTLCWNVDSDPSYLINKVDTYDIEMPRQSRIVTIMSVRVDGRPLVAKSRDELDSLVPGWPDEVGEPAYFNEHDGGLRIYPRPLVQAGVRRPLRTRVAFAPTRAADSIPDHVVEVDRDALVWGALARLLAMPEKAWSRPSEAVYFDGKFREQSDQRRLLVMHDGAIGSLTVSPRPFGF